MQDERETCFAPYQTNYLLANLLTLQQPQPQMKMLSKDSLYSDTKRPFSSHKQLIKPPNRVNPRCGCASQPSVRWVSLALTV